jgi:hypothetical protein
MRGRWDDAPPPHANAQKTGTAISSGMTCRDEHQTFGSVRLAADQQVLANSLRDNFEARHL